MALVRNLEKLASERTTLHEEVVARYSIFERDGRGFVQINTYGRSDREFPEKVSQSIQLDREGAWQVYSIIKSAFRFD